MPTGRFAWNPHIIKSCPTPNANTWLWRLVIRVYWMNQVPLRVIMEVAVGAYVMRWASGAPLPSPPPPPPKMHISTSGWSSPACSMQVAARRKGRATPLLLLPPINSAFLSNCDVIHDQWLWLSQLTSQRSFVCKFFLWTSAVQETKQSAYTKYNSVTI